MVRVRQATTAAVECSRRAAALGSEGQHRDNILQRQPGVELCGHTHPAFLTLHHATSGNMHETTEGVQAGSMCGSAPAPLPLLLLARRRPALAARCLARQPRCPCAPSSHHNQATITTNKHAVGRPCDELRLCAASQHCATKPCHLALRGDSAAEAESLVVPGAERENKQSAGRGGQCKCCCNTGGAGARSQRWWSAEGRQSESRGAFC